MLRRRLRLARQRSRHGKSSHVPFSHAAIVARARRHRLRSWCHRVRLPARMALPAKRFPKAHFHLASRSVYEWPRFGVDRGRISTRYARSPLTYDSHDEASSLDDGCCTADFGGRARISLSVRVTQGLH